MASLFPQKGLKKQPKAFWLVFFTLFCLLLLGFYLALRFGAIAYSTQDLWTTLQEPFRQNALSDVIIDLRLPRVIAAALVGAAMASSGAIMQGVTKNPIADPGLLGINAGAGLALILTYAFWGSIPYLGLILVCLLGSLLATFLVFGLAYQRQKGFPPLRLLLAGVMVASFFTALGQAITLAFNLSTRVIGWQAGGLAATNWSMLGIIAPLILLGLVLAQLQAHQLNILSLDGQLAQALGQSSQKVRLRALATVLLLSATAVSLVGAIAFVGLIIPHAIASLVKKDYRQLLPLTALAGAVFLIWVDLVCRLIQAPKETPISAVISLVGLPCFLWLVRRERL
ncbi:FecCD family ABC transporter permease [Streptococcus sp. DD12]|uniref:FecCD family ABC transporter permease n=1 Tax=Streptococcus sp. DD12 TaxID=1777880 RepID=UPI000795AC2C|nr:iron ABC transporter permease [Streptococcus sp. DD12]KXT75828.1 ABC-type Fe3+-siderophore transport system, permease component [Streptococcus sp. DD12]